MASLRRQNKHFMTHGSISINHLELRDSFWDSRKEVKNRITVLTDVSILEHAIHPTTLVKLCIIWCHKQLFDHSFLLKNIKFEQCNPFNSAISFSPYTFNNNHSFGNGYVNWKIVKGFLVLWIVRNYSNRANFLAQYEVNCYDLCSRKLYDRAPFELI
jgi:hypothetical protein